MTREEAIEVIKQDIPCEYDTDLIEALDMAIKALEQEPCKYWQNGKCNGNTEVCEDAVSRQAVMDCFKKWQPYMATRLWDFEQELSQLPSVNPQEPKMGHWIDDTRLGYHVSICSNCDWRGHGDTCLIYKPKYCPNCGARMAESEDEG